MICTVCRRCFYTVVFLMRRRPPRSTRTDTLFPYTTLFRSVRLVGACAQDAARSMIFERPSDEVHAIGEQGRGERIALQSRHRLAVECEAQRPGTVDASALRRPEICRHDWATSGAASPTL